MAALGEKAEELAIAELGEADRTAFVGGAEEAVTGLVGPGGDGVDGGLVKADGADVPHMVDVRLLKFQKVAVDVSVTVFGGRGRGVVAVAAAEA